MFPVQCVLPTLPPFLVSSSLLVPSKSSISHRVYTVAAADCNLKGWGCNGALWPYEFVDVM